MKNIILISSSLLLCLIFMSENLLANTYIAFRNDDISAKSNPVYEYEVLQVFRKYEIKPLFAVIPAASGIYLEEGAIVDSLKSWYKKDYIDLAMHGYTHEKKFSTMSYYEQNDRISKGKQVLKDALEIDISWFAPPWNAVDKNTLKALRENKISNFSGYLGESEIENLTYLNCNCNVFNGPLGSLSEKIINAKKSKNDVVLVSLYHTNYDFDNNSLAQLDSLLNYVSSLDIVKISSFTEFSENKIYSDMLRMTNQAGYYLKILQNNKYIRRIVLKVPVVSNYFNNKVVLAEEFYWNGNYSGVINIYNKLIMACLVTLVIILSTVIIIVTIFFNKMKSKEK